METSLDFIAHIPPLLESIVLFCFVLGAIELGYRLGATRRRNTEESGDNGVLQGAILGLVGLLLAFMFSFGATRYDHRRDLVVKEANAIGTAYLRTSLVPEPARTQLRSDYVRYTDTRIAFYRTVPGSPERAAAAKTSDELQTALWSRSSSAALADRGPLMSLVIASLNDVIDVSAEQLDSLDDLVPGPIILLLLITVVISGAVTGYGFGLNGARNTSYALAFTLLVTVVSYTILDLSSPEEGLIRTNLTSLEAFRSTLPHP